METKVSGSKKEVLISSEKHTVIIGERINPSGKKKLAEALKTNNFEVIKQEALDQVAAGAEILDVNVVTPEVDEVALLPEMIGKIMNVVDVPLCIDFNNPAALAEALKVYKGKPVINSVSGEEKSLNFVLPLVREYGTAVIALTLDDSGIPKTAEKRLEIARKIIDRAEKMGIHRENIIIDCLALALSSDDKAAITTLRAIRMVRDELGVNQTLGASNISFGLPDRPLINKAFLSLAIEAGLTCPTVDADKVRSSILATDLILGRDRYSQRYISDFRKHQNENKI